MTTTLCLLSVQGLAGCGIQWSFPAGAVYWWGFVLPIPPVFAVVRTMLIVAGRAAAEWTRFGQETFEKFANAEKLIAIGTLDP